MKFTTPEELAAYFGGDKIECLLCNKHFRAIGTHLMLLHNVSPDEYREMYGIPWTYGLICAGTKQKKSAIAKKNLAAGLFQPGKYLDRANAKPPRARVPVRDTLTARNLEKLNKDKTGEEAARRKAAPKKGSPEFHAKMSKRQQCVNAGERFGDYWRGKEQTPEHVLKRTGHPKKPKNG